MDSGSADFWVGSENCQAEGGGGCVSCAHSGYLALLLNHFFNGNHTLLGQKSSSSFHNTTRSFEVIYGSGAVEGSIVQDNVAIAGLPLKNHTFGVAYLETSNLASDQTPFDGLMGLARSVRIVFLIIRTLIPSILAGPF